MEKINNYNWHNRSIESTRTVYKTGVFSDAIDAIKKMVRPSISSRGFVLKK